jgi:hypothetical protein
MTGKILHHTALVTDSSTVRVVEEGVETWRGPILELERMNCFDDEECANLRSALHQTGRYVSGGGAGTLVTVQLVGRYLVTVIGAADVETRFFPTEAVAVAIAERAFRKSEGMAAVTVLDLEAGETVVNLSPPILQRDLLAISSLLNPSQRVA